MEKENGVLQRFGYAGREVQEGKDWEKNAKVLAFEGEKGELGGDKGKLSVACCLQEKGKPKDRR